MYKITLGRQAGIFRTGTKFIKESVRKDERGWKR